MYVCLHIRFPTHSLAASDLTEAEVEPEVACMSQLIKPPGLDEENSQLGLRL